MGGPRLSWSGVSSSRDMQAEADGCHRGCRGDQRGYGLSLSSLGSCGGSTLLSFEPSRCRSMQGSQYGLLPQSALGALSISLPDPKQPLTHCPVIGATGVVFTVNAGGQASQSSLGCGINPRPLPQPKPPSALDQIIPVAF